MEKDNNPEDVKLQIEPLISSDSPIRSHSFSVPQSHDSTPGNSEEEKNQLIQMGFEERMITKVYTFLKPRTINEAIDLMSEENGIYQHEFIEGRTSSSSSNINLCYICNKKPEFHINYEHNKEEDNDEIITIENKDEGKDKEKDSFVREYCPICFLICYKKEMFSLDCGHKCCKYCIVSYIKTEIKSGKAAEIRCFINKCNNTIPEDQILSIIKSDNGLIKKYNIFKQRAIIFNSQDKKFCPEPDCNSYLQEDLTNKYVQCENGHKYCYICLKPWHGESKCDEKLDKDFQIWKKDKVVKRCPRCKIYTEKNEGCNHMTCTECKYQWCWLCEGEYQKGHFSSGQCNGLQFAKINYLSEKKERKVPDLNDPYRSRDVNSDNSDGCCICDNNIPDKLYHVWLTHEGMLYNGHPVLSFIVSFTVFVFCVNFIATVAWFFNVFDDNEKIARKKYLRVFIILVGIMQCAAFLIQSTFVMILFCFFSIFFRGNNWFKRVHENNTKHFTYNISAYRNVME